MSNYRILIIEDEPQIRRLLSITLASGEYEVMEAQNGAEGIRMASSHAPDLILLDLGLPDKNGHDVLRVLREWFTRPVIIISVRSNEADIIKALDNGANDYVIKPFRMGELLARIRSAIRKGSTDDHQVHRFQHISIDYVNRIVRRFDEVVKLTATEFNLLSVLSQHEGKVLTHQFLLKEVWGPSHQQESQYLRVFIAQLRKKIEADPNRPELILTESGIGYRFMSREAELKKD